ncbi:MAG: DUF302 domain-containing protein [Thermococci archaeon]|nr:DUF302 domain-containing protein [Thermococci archaeon]
MGFDMVVTKRSRYGYEETIERIKKAAEEAGWSVVGEVDFEAKIGIKGYVVEICNGGFAKRALGKEENRWIAAFMPCRIAVVQNSDGVYVHSMNMAAFAEMIPGEIGDLLREVSKADDEITNAVL